MSVQFFASDFDLMFWMYSHLPPKMRDLYAEDPRYLVRFDLDTMRCEIGYGSDQWESSPDVDLTLPPRCPHKQCH